MLGEVQSRPVWSRVGSECGGRGASAEQEAIHVCENCPAMVQTLRYYIFYNFTHTPNGIGTTLGPRSLAWCSICKTGL